MCSVCHYDDLLLSMYEMDTSIQPLYAKYPFPYTRRHDLLF